MDQFNLIYNFLLYSFAFVAIGYGLESDIWRNNRNTSGTVISVIFLCAMLVLFGLRDVEIGTDTEMYYWQYKMYQDIDLGTDFLIYYIFAFLNMFSKDPVLFFILMAALYITTFGTALTRYAKLMVASPLLVVFSFAGFFFFQTMGINIIRQGVSMGFFLLGIIYYLENPQSFWRKGVLIPMLVAVGFHFTALVPIMFLLISVYFGRIKLWAYLALYAVTVVISAFNGSILIFKDLFNISALDERRSSYLDAAEFADLYSIGFKPQFVAFNTLFLIIFLLIRKYIFTSDAYEKLLRYFLLCSSLFFMVFQLPYSDRWGVMSWVIIPFLLAPVFRNSNHVRLATAAVLMITVISIFFQIYTDQSASS